MINRTTKLRWRRKFRRSRHQVEDLGVQAEEQIERHFFKRLSRLAGVRRFLLAWTMLMLLLVSITAYQLTALSPYYQSLQPVRGGTFAEGVIGNFTNANPLYATGPVDSAVARLVFAGLLTYDQKNNLVGDLAEKWVVNESGTVYTVTLKPNLRWHDGQELTAKDVAFTFNTIQNPDAKSPLFSSWQGITVTAATKQIVTFTLPNALSAFPHSLVTGIIPAHKLADTPAAQLRATQFNTESPIGSGPFVWNAVEVSRDSSVREGKIGLLANPSYHRGEPALEQFVIHFFTDESRMIASFGRNEITAMSSVSTVPDTLSIDPTIKQHNVPLTAQVMVFFKNSNPVFADKRVRQALVQAVNQNNLLDNLGFPVITARQPFLQDHPGYDPALNQLAYNKDKAAALLTEAGWILGSDGIRVKDGKQLTFGLYSESTSEFAYVTQKLQGDWGKIGVKVEVLLQPDSDLQTTVTYHNYDALLYGISLGPDPDVYAYWGSTQADERAANRVNFSEYKSAVADKALEGGRTRSDPTLRAVKYKPFLEVWRDDAPALALYQPRYLYITRDPFSGFDLTTINTATDRYTNVQNWKIRQAKVDKI